MDNYEPFQRVDQDHFHVSNYFKRILFYLIKIDLWNNGLTSREVSVKSGTYSVQIIDNVLGCNITISETLAEPRMTLFIHNLPTSI